MSEDKTNGLAQQRSSIDLSAEHGVRERVNGYRWRGDGLTDEAHGVGDYSEKVHEYLKRRNQPSR